MASFFEDNDDLRFYLERGIDWASLVEVTEQGFTNPDGFSSTEEALEFYREIAELVGEFVANEIAPHAARIDAEGVALEDGEVRFPPTLRGIFDKIRELELHGMCLPRELGGMNTPMMLYFITSELLARGDVSVMTHHGFHGGMALAMLIFSLREGSSKVDPETGRILETRWRREIEEIAEGKAWGCMDITEPHAGSDMAQLRATAEEDEDGQWRVTGEKIFITSGHGKYHFVIARTEKPGDPSDPMAGLGGLSMFLVPTYEEDPDGNRTRVVEIARVEEKLGHHGSATCALVFDRAPAQLVGVRGEGFKHMLTLMNNARLGVGFESLGLCEAAYRAAKAYAEERPSMGKTIDRHEMIADYLDEMRTDIQGIRALAMYGAVHEELGQKLDLALQAGRPVPGRSKEDVAREVRRHRRRARRATPLLKYLAAEKAVELARRGLQIHGGNGYITEYPAEKLLRDALVMPIYEGTSQIQALMAMKDTLLGIMKNPQAFVRRTARAQWRALSAREPLERRVAQLSVLSLAAQRYLVARTAGDKFKRIQGEPLAAWPERFRSGWNPKQDFAYAMLHAERLTQLLADEMICQILLEQAQQHPDRAEVLERYLERAEPRCRLLLEQITTTGSRLLAQLSGTPEAVADAAE